MSHHFDQSISSGGLHGTAQDDTLTAQVSRGSANLTNQIHVWGMGGTDRLVSDFSLMAGVGASLTAGAHLRGDSVNAPDLYADTFVFSNTAALTSGTIITGRIEDYDSSRDTIEIDSTVIDLTDPLSLPDNVSVVEYNGFHNDPGALPQQWLRIETANGATILYSLGGARVDMTGDGDSNGGDQEGHFISWISQATLNSLPEVDYVDPVNFVPEGYFAREFGVVINDYDADAADVARTITGTWDRDLIAGGLNDDTISAGKGYDAVWGGSGHDTIYGGDGMDELRGGPGHDFIYGGNHGDLIYGDSGNDRLYGDAGNDTMYGGTGDDNIMSGDGDDMAYGGAGVDYLVGGAGHDTLYGGDGDDRLDGNNGNDALYGGAGRDFLLGQHSDDLIVGGAGGDTLSGGPGNDTFHFYEGDLVNWFDETAGTEQERRFQLDLITDFEIGADRIVIDGFDGISSRSDMWCGNVTYDGNMYFLVGLSGGNQLMVDVADDVTWLDFFGPETFYQNFEIV